MVRLPSSDHVGLCTYMDRFFENVIWGGFTEGVYVFVLHRAPRAVRHLPQKKCPTWSSTSSQWSSTALRLLKVCEINNLGRVKNSCSLIQKKGCISPQGYPSTGVLGQKCIEKNILHPVASTPFCSSKVQAFSDSCTQEAPPVFKFPHYGLCMLNI